MTDYTYDGYVDITVAVDESNSTYMVERTGIIGSSMSVFQEQNGVHKNTFIIEGAIFAGNGYQAINLGGEQGDRVTVGQDGLIGGGVTLAGLHSTVVNHGRIIAADGLSAVNLNGMGSSFENFGYVSGTSSFRGTAINHKGAVLANDGVAIYFSGAVGERNTFINDGEVMTRTAGLSSFYGSSGNETFINDGSVRGGVRLYDGMDHFVSHGGEIYGYVDAGNGDDIIKVRGAALFAFRDDGGGIEGGEGDDFIDMRNVHLKDVAIWGGKGDDTYLVDNAHVVPVDLKDEGEDTVRSTVSYTLNYYLDDLRLLGGKDIDATGSSIDNKLIGNTGDNVLNGLAGVDALDGGKGDDKLYGGSDADTFGFATGYGKDEIKDFHRGEDDRIYVHNWKGIDTLKDVRSHAEDHQGDVWITVGHDTLVIDHMHRADLAAGDFQF